MTRAARKPSLPPDQLLILWQSSSLLLNYPDEELIGKLETISAALDTLPSSLGAGLRSCVTYLSSTPLAESQPEYVETFDSRRRCNLFLTYFAHGDTRKRGMALLRFKQTYAQSGFALDDSELPDHLCVVLEYSALIDQTNGRQLMLDHRAGLELLRLSLRDMRSPWFSVVDDVCSTLPALRGDERDAVSRLAAEGPPEEEVGLTPYGTPSFDPALLPPPGATPGPKDLPMPAFRGART
ncbi:MAG: nitrate reductase molybdenum cofactor assembly chaperone [Aeromicrobium sp.]